MLKKSLNKEILEEAASLLFDDNLVWDADFELIRPYLACVMINQSKVAWGSDPELIRIAKLLIDTTIH